MELIENLESLKVGDYIKVYPSVHHHNTKYCIVVIEKISKDRIFLKIIRTTKGENKEEHHGYYSEEILPIVKTFIKKPKKKKLKHKKYSFNKHNVIFKLNQKERSSIVKMAILKSL